MQLDVSDETKRWGDVGGGVCTCCVCERVRGRGRGWGRGWGRGRAPAGLMAVQFFFVKGGGEADLRRDEGVEDEREENLDESGEFE